MGKNRIEIYQHFIIEKITYILIGYLQFKSVSMRSAIYIMLPPINHLTFGSELLCRRHASSIYCFTKSKTDFKYSLDAGKLLNDMNS